MKLGFILKRTYGGDGKIGGINECEPLSRSAVDVRSLIAQLNGFEVSDKEVVLLRFLGSEGYLVTFIRAISGGRGGDNIAAWIHFPINLRISKEEMRDLIGEVEKGMDSQVHRSDFDRENWSKIFGKEFEKKKVRNPIVGTINSKEIRGGEVACRYYDNGKNYSLCELLVDYVAQQEYNDYSGIFLIDSQSGVTLTKKNNVIDGRPRKTVVFSLPANSEGFKASYVDGKLSGTIEVLEGYEFLIKWSKRGYKDIEKKIIVDVDEGQMLEPAKIEPSEKQIIVHREWFKVLDADGKDISPNSKITINGNEFKDKVLYVTEVAKYRVEFSCKGYKAESGSDYFEKEYDRLPSDSSATTVKTSLRIVLYNQKFQLPSDQGNDLKYDMRVVVTSQEQTNGSPFRGYEVTGDKELRYVGERKNPRSPAPMWKNPKFYAVCAIVALVFLILGIGISKKSNDGGVKKLETVVSGLEKDKSNLEKDTARLNGVVADCEDKIASLEDKIKDLEVLMDSSKVEMSESAKQISTLRDSIRILNRTIKDKDKTIDSLKKRSGAKGENKNTKVKDKKEKSSDRERNSNDNWWKKIFRSSKKKSK